MNTFLKQYAFNAAYTQGSELTGDAFRLCLKKQSSDTDEQTVFGQLDQAMAPLLKSLQDQHLNQSTGVADGTMPHLLKWVVSELEDSSLQEVTLENSRKQTLTWKKEVSALSASQHYEFHSAHFLPRVPMDHKCGNLHGHNFQAVLEWNTEAETAASNQAEVHTAFLEVHQQLHHKLLNSIEGLTNPTSENICAWIWENLADVLPQLNHVTIYETETAGNTYGGKLWDCFKWFSMDSAITKDAQIFGHTYQIGLHIESDIDPYMGWTTDFGDIKALFKDYYKELDHHHLNDVRGCNSPFLVDVAASIKQELYPSLPDLQRIEIWNTRTSGAMYEC